MYAIRSYYGFYRLLNLSVVSYAIPALIAVGIVIFKKKKSGKLMHWFRKGAEKKALQILHDSMPASGGFLEAIPLTAFVALSLINAGYGHTAVVEKGIDFLKSVITSYSIHYTKLYEMPLAGKTIDAQGIRATRLSNTSA